MLKNKEEQKKTNMFHVSIANSKLQSKKQLEEVKVVSAEYVAQKEEAAKCKKEESTRHYLPYAPIRGEEKVDLQMSSPIKKKLKSDTVMETVIEVDMDAEDNEEKEESMEVKQ
jgi:hypothetical protein